MNGTVRFIFIERPDSDTLQYIKRLTGGNNGYGLGGDEWMIEFKGDHILTMYEHHVPDSFLNWFHQNRHLFRTVTAKVFGNVYKNLGLYSFGSVRISIGLGNSMVEGPNIELMRVGLQTLQKSNLMPGRYELSGNASNYEKQIMRLRGELGLLQQENQELRKKVAAHV